ncbi:MAG TPA: ZIP family zinc transporter, partial [Allosphingosinicella sp.]|nr:ZIP family zinc transporter [Allosphingosinicella sp.]
LPVAAGFLGGAALFTACNFALGFWGARHRKRSTAEHRKQDAASCPENGSALALGALLDGIPESIVIGVSLLEGHGVGLVAVIAVFLSNLPEGLSSAAGMKAEGRRAGFVFLLWTAVALIAGLAALLGYLAFDGAPPGLVAAVQAVAAGAILAMIVDTMVPEAFEGTQDFAGIVAVAGFLTAFALSKLAG